MEIFPKERKIELRAAFSISVELLLVHTIDTTSFKQSRSDGFIKAIILIGNKME